MKRIFGLLAILGTLTVMQPDGSVKVYATFPMGGTQMSVLELDTGRTWMIRKSDAHGNTVDIIDYDNGEMVHLNTTDGCTKCGDWKQMVERFHSDLDPRKSGWTSQTDRGYLDFGDIRLPRHARQE
jgi:hypothetical protein